MRASTTAASPSSRRSPCACSTTCSTSPSGRCRSSTTKRMHKRRIGLGFTGLGDALVMLNLRYDSDAARAMARHIAEVLRDCGLRRVGRPGARTRRLPALQCRPVPQPRHLRVAPAGSAEGAHPPARPAQLAPAVDRAHRHDQPGLRRQREQRHRARVLLALHAQEARRPTAPSRNSAVEDHAWRLYRHLKGDDAPLTPAFVTALEMTRAGACGDGRGRRAVHRHLDLARP